MGVEFGISMLTDRLMPEAASSKSISRPSSAGIASESAGPSFKDTLASAIGDVSDALKAADTASQKFASGQSTSLHDVMIAMEKADISLRTVTAVRNKVLDAYQEIMRMPV